MHEAGHVAANANVGNRRRLQAEVREKTGNLMKLVQFGFVAAICLPGVEPLDQRKKLLARQIAPFVLDFV